MTSGKTAIICAGGSIRSAHTAGFLHTLGSRALVNTPDIIIGSSGSGVITSYYLSRQWDHLRRAFAELLPTRRFMSLMRIRPIIDVDYLVDDLIKREIPLDVQAIRAGTSRSLVPATNAESGQTRYFTDSDDVDYFELLRATCAIPLLYGKTVALGDGRYIDGEIGVTMQDHVNVAIAYGAKRLVLLDDTQPWHHQPR